MSYVTTTHTPLATAPSPPGEDPRMGISARWDPVWDPTGWPVGVDPVVWRTPAATRRAQQRKGEISGTPGMRSRRSQPAAVLRRVLAGWEHRSALGTLLSWQTLTAEQLAAFAGQHARTTANDRMAARWWGGGLVQIGGFRAGGASQGRPLLLRPERRLARLTLASLTAPDWCHLTADGQVTQTHHISSSRHNVITAELSLRAAELCPTLVAVTGEPTAQWRHVVRSADVPAKISDARWIRSDGMQILVEVIASKGSRIAAEMESVRELLRHDLTESVWVLFMAIKRPTRDTANHWDTRKGVKIAVEQMLRADRSGVGRRIAVASVRAWYPAPGVYSPGAVSLAAERCVSGYERRWEPVDLGTPFSAPPGSPGSDELIAAAKTWAGNPPWFLVPPDEVDRFDALRRAADRPPPRRTAASAPRGGPA
ncbi:MAG: hypothetical protein ACYDHU_09140 [Acidimicrobiales bacterium]